MHKQRVEVSNAKSLCRERNSNSAPGRMQTNMAGRQCVEISLWQESARGCSCLPGARSCFPPHRHGNSGWPAPGCSGPAQAARPCPSSASRREQGSRNTAAIPASCTWLYARQRCDDGVKEPRWRHDRPRSGKHRITWPLDQLLQYFFLYLSPSVMNGQHILKKREKECGIELRSNNQMEEHMNMIFFWLAAALI